MGADNDVSSYLKALDDFKVYVKKINSENSTKKQHYGYLINLNNYYTFKENLKANNINSSFIKCYDKEKIRLSPLDTSDLMVKLNSGYKFIIINDELHKKICRLKDQNTHQIEYIISPEKIILYAENGHEFHFKNNKDNKIDKLSLLNYIPKTNKINDFKIDANKIYMDIINYYKMEKEISEKLKNERTQEEKFIGFLVDIAWLNNWKKYSFYDKIKNEFLLKKKNDKNKIINIIKEELKTTGLNYNKIKNIENYIIKDINQLQSEQSSSQSFALINQEFLYTFNNNDNIGITPFKFYLSYQKIQIKPLKGEIINFTSDNNIISKELYHIEGIIVKKPNKNKQKDKHYNIYDSNYLKHLIKTYFFKKEFFSEYSAFQKQLTSAYIINKKVIHKLNEMFKLTYLYDDLLQYIESNSQLRDIKYQNYNDKYPIISQFLNESHNNYINEIKQIENKGIISFSKEESYLNYKYLNNNKDLLNIDDFDIIDKEFGEFLIEKYKSNIDIKQIHFAYLKNNNIILMSDIIYEIASFDSNYNFTVQYLAKFNSFNFNDMNSFQEYFYQFLLYKDVHNLINKGNPIISDDNKISFNLYPINNDFNKNYLYQSQNQFNNCINIQNNNNIFENKDNISNSKNENIFKEKAQKNCCLISKNFSELIVQSKKRNIDINGYIVDENENTNKKINDVLYSDLGKYQINIGHIDIKKNNKRIFFPINFDLIDKKQLMKNQIQNIKNIIEEVNLFYIHRGCFMIPKNNNFNNEKDNLIFLYSIHENGDKTIYKPIAVIDCLNNQERNNAIYSFVQISENNDVIKNPKLLENNYNCTCYIIKYDNDDNSNLILLIMLL